MPAERIGMRDAHEIIRLTYQARGAGKKFNPHVTIGVAPQTYLDKMFAEPFEAFTFAPVGAVVYQLGTFGTARKELQTFP